MPYSHFFARPLLLSALLALHPFAGASDDIIIDDGGMDEGIVIEAGDGGELMIDASTAAPADEVMIDAGDATTIDVGDAPMIEDAVGGDELTIDPGTEAGGDAIMIDDAAGAGDDGIAIDEGVAPLDDGPAIDAIADELPLAGADRIPGRFTIGIDSARFEYGYFTDGSAASDNSLYGNVAASANWQPSAEWELQLAGRVDGFDEDGEDSFTTIRGDYGDSFIRYRGETTTLTFGTQTVIWGRMDEVPLSDRVSTADLTRGILDDLDDRRRSAPAVRAESYVGGGKLDMVWLYDFRGAELPDQDSIWYPVNTRDGRLPGIDPDDVPPALIQGARVDDDAPSGDGGFGARYTRTHSIADIGVTLARSRQSVPYFRAAGPGLLEAEYPRSWIVGADTAVNAAGAIWRAEVVYSSDNPVTRTNLDYTTTPGIQWGAGVEFFPGDGDSRVTLQLIGNNLIDAPSVFDRTQSYNFTGEVEIPFDRERWRLDIDFIVGVDHRETYLNPEVTFLGWEPHEIYLGAHYFDGDDQSLGGFYQDNSVITLGWRASF